MSHSGSLFLSCLCEDYSDLQVLKGKQCFECFAWTMLREQHGIYIFFEVWCDLMQLYPVLNDLMQSMNKVSSSIVTDDSIGHRYSASAV